MTAHLDALNLRLSHERVRAANAKTANERALRNVWIAQIEKEIVAEQGFVATTVEMSDDELLAALTN